MYLWPCGSFKTANDQKDWVRKSQIRKVPRLRTVRTFCIQTYKTINAVHLITYSFLPFAPLSFSLLAVSFLLIRLTAAKYGMGKGGFYIIGKRGKKVN